MSSLLLVFFCLVGVIVIEFSKALTPLIVHLGALVEGLATAADII